MKFDMRKMVPEIGERNSLNGPVPYATYQRHIGRYIFASQFVLDKSVLDIGCGVGAGSKYFASRGAKKVIGADISGEAIKEARANNNHADTVEFMVADAQTLPFPNDYFDAIISLETIEHLEDPENFLLECRRVIKKGGTFVCSTPNKRVTTPLFKRPANPYHVKEYYPKEFFTFISSHFSDVIAYGQRTLNLRDRLKPGLIIIVRRALDKIPYGDSLRKLLRRIFKFTLMEPHLPEFREDFDEMADKFYEVTPFKETLVKTPETLIVVARMVNK